MSSTTILALALLGGATLTLAQDPCAAIGGKKWVKPSEVRACYTSFPVVEAEKTNARITSYLVELDLTRL